MVMTDKELYQRGVTEYGIILYRLKAMEIRQIQGGLWLKRIRIYHPIGLLLFIIFIILAPFITLFSEETLQGVLKEIIEQFITGTKTT